MAKKPVVVTKNNDHYTWSCNFCGGEGKQLFEIKKTKGGGLVVTICRGCIKLLADKSNVYPEVGNLLALMHGDGGHYQAKVGTNKAARDAQGLLHTKWITQEDLPF